MAIARAENDVLCYYVCEMVNKKLKLKLTILIKCTNKIKYWTKKFLKTIIIFNVTSVFWLRLKQLHKNFIHI